MSEEGKKLYLFVGIFNMFFLAKKYILVGNVYVMSEEKMKKS